MNAHVRFRRAWRAWRCGEVLCALVVVLAVGGGGICRADEPDGGAGEEKPAGEKAPARKGAGGKAAGAAGAGEKAAPAEPQSLLYVEPFDEVTLDADNSGAVLKVFPIEFPNRRVPKAPQPTDTFEVRLRDHPDQTFELAWKSVKRVKLFEQMLMDQAADLTAGGQFDEAYQYYELLEQKYPKTAGVKQAVEDYLWTDALDAINQDQYEQALAMLIELERRDAKRSGLAETFAKTTGRLVELSIKQKNYRAARGWLKSLAQRFPDDSAAAVNTTVKRYEAQLIERAKALQAKAQSQWKSRQTAQAWRSAAAMLDVWPAIPGGLELAKEIQAEHPTVVVGVVGLPGAEPDASGADSTSAAGGAGPRAGVLDDWPQRRVSRLLRRQLVEVVGPGPTGATYLAPLATIERRPQLALRLRSVTPGVRSLTAPDVADCLVRLADPYSPAFDPAFAEMFVGAKIEGIDTLAIELRSSQAAEGWLLGALDAGQSGDPVVASAPFTVAAQSASEARYVANPKYVLLEPGGPREIVERAYSDSTAALVALRSGQISVIGRLSPWDAPVARAAEDLSVEAYAFPTVHVLVPNRRKPLLANRTFRRAVEYAIDRAGIMNRALLAGRAVAGSQVISGPFPQGADNDPHGYGYDAKVAVRPYEPSLARLLVSTALAETGAKAARHPAGYLVGPLTLVHPPDPAAEVACLSIRRQLQAAGIDVTLREAGPNDPLGDFDLAYLELAMQEPCVDVWRLLGPGALGGTPSPYLQQALADLLAAGDWPQACARLKAIHRLVHDEVDVIPLWQLVEHLAHSSSVAGIGERPVTLYDHVEKWQLELKAPSQ